MRFALAWTVLVTIPASSLLAGTPVDEEFFEKRIRPILSTHCQSCHDAKKQKGGLQLTSRAAMLAGGDTGPAIVAGEANKSLLVRAVRYEGDLRMPPRGKLSAEEIELLSQWIAGGAPWARSDDRIVSSQRAMDVKALASNHWSYHPVRAVSVSGTVNPVDHFIRKKLEENGLKPALPADKRTLLRRITFDLTGLPPTQEELESFEADTSSSAYERVVERLLASPHHGERWGRHWLDLMRFAETQGHEFDFEIPNAWRYRDYVIRAINEDLPYNQFVKEHIAGDLLPEPRRRHSGENESIVATGFWYLGEAKHSPVDIRQDQADRLDNMIDVFGKAFLGQTIACARCHDHKFDPIPQRDYYALFGILASSQYQQAFLDSPAETEKLLGELKDARNSLEFELGKADRTVAETKAWKPTEAQLSWYTSGPAFRSSTFPIHSGRESQNLRGGLRSGTFEIPSQAISLLVAGRQAQVRLIIDNFQLIRNPIYGGLQKDVKHGEEYRWITFDVARWKGHHAYLELLDEGSGYIALKDVVFGEGKTGPSSSTTPPPAVEPILPGSASKRARELAAEIRRLEAQLSRNPARAPAMAEGNGFNEKLFIRGNHKTLGAEVPRGFLELFTNNRSEPSGSGRLELAETLTDPANPLLARVLVNRVWHHYFGTGIVASPDDFGRQGQPPSHPELLDFLAAEFVRQGWSMKRLHRMIVLSQTYQQSSLPHQETESLAASVDPSNRLLHRAPVRRLEAEAIRDAMLQISGRLDRTIGGPSIPPHLTQHMNGRGRPGTSGPLDGDGRRTIYLQVRRNFLSPMLVAFDFPTPFSAIGRRGTSNVPAQALVMLNNPFVHQQAEHWAERVLALEKRSNEDRLRIMYREAFTRLPAHEEQNALLEHVKVRSREAGPQMAWKEVAHVLLNSKAFVFVQ